MPIYRFPVPDHPDRLPPRLPCIDFAPDTSGTRTGERCRLAYQAHLEAGKAGKLKGKAARDFKCPNLGNKQPGKCWLASFLYPRKRGGLDPDHVMGLTSRRWRAA